MAKSPTDNFKGKGDHDNDGTVGGAASAKTPAPAQKPTVCRMVLVCHADPAIPPAAGVVTRVYDDGSINVMSFLPDGGNSFVTGLISKDAHDALAEDNPARNLPWWDWPPRA